MVKHGWPGGLTVLTLGGDCVRIWLTVATVVGNGWAKKMRHIGNMRYRDEPRPPF
jgi:hypothetical protein